MSSVGAVLIAIDKSHENHDGCSMAVVVVSPLTYLEREMVFEAVVI